jgi:hypothetical protein
MAANVGQISGFNSMFSIPRTPGTAYGAGQYFDLKVPKGKKVIITDIYAENLGGGLSELIIEEQRGPNNFEVRYAFRIGDLEKFILNFTTGLRLGDESPILGNIRIENSINSKAHILPRINGIIV